MKKLLLSIGGVAGAAGIIAASGTAFAASNNANANGYTRQLETKAQVLNMTADELKQQLQTRTLYQIAEDKGVSVDALHTAVTAQAKERWQASGMTAEQIQQREQQMAQRQADCDGTGMQNGGGMRHGAND